MSDGNCIDDFRGAIERAGITPPGQIVADGALHRYASNGNARDDSGWYVLHADGFPAGAFGCWRAGVSETWHAEPDRELTAEERRAQRERIEAVRREREREEQRRQSEAAERATTLWAVAQPAARHAYLAAKGVRAYGVRVDDEGRLVVAMRDAAGVLWSVQRISDDGEKRFLPGSRVTGCYHAIGEPGERIVVAEGYATAASVHEATGDPVAVAFNAGNLGPVARALRAKFPNAEIVIAGDNDESGVGQAKAREAAFEIGGVVALPNEGGMDWNDVHREHGAAAVRAGIEFARLAEVAAEDGGESQRVRSEPEPLRRPVPPAAPYPLDALGDVLGPAAKRIRDVVQAPDALCGQAILAAASLAVQPHADVFVDGRREPLSLWVISIAESGERKSAVDQVALEAHKAHERAALARWKLDKATFEIEQMAYETAAKAVSKGKDQDVIKDAMMKLGGPPDAPLMPLLLVGTPTIEGIHKLYKFGQPSLGLFHDDAAEFLGGHAMNKDNRAKSAAGLSKLWDTGEFDRIRAADGAEKFFGRRLALHLMMQPVIAESILSDDVLTGQGFLARSLLAWPESTIGSRRYVEIDLSTDPALARYRSVITALLERSLPLRPETRNELDPRPLVLSPPAKAAWIAVHDAIETDMRARGEFSSVRAWASKAPAQALRIAGVLTLIEDADASVIDVDAIDRAAALVLFALGEASRVIGTAMVPQEVKQAEALLAWCHSERIRLLHSRAALQFGPSSIRTKGAFDAAIAVLDRAGWASPIEGGAVIDGAHRRRVWLIGGAK